MDKLPLARNTNIIVQEAGKELLIYDLNIHQAFNLNETSKIIYRHCNGKTSLVELKRKYKFTDDLIYFALEELQQYNLIESEKINYFGKLTRRQVIRQVG